MDQYLTRCSYFSLRHIFTLYTLTLKYSDPTFGRPGGGAIESGGTAMNNGRFETQTNNKEIWVGVSSDGIHRDTGTPVASEFLIQDKSTGIRTHIGFDENGNQIF